MRTTWKHLGDLVFEGGRYAEQGLELPDLADVVRFQELLAHTCKALWRRNHPGRARLPKGFKRLTTLRLSPPKSGSFLLPLEMRAAVQPELPWAEGIVEQAAALVHESIDRLNRGDRLPDDLPTSAVPYLADLGQTLLEGEGMALALAGKTRAVFQVSTRERARALRTDRYCDRIDISGTVVLADVEGSRFQVKIGDQPSVPGEFPPEYEEDVLDALRNYSRARVRVVGRGEFDFATRRLQRILNIESMEVTGGPGPNPECVPEKPLWQLAEELAAQVPPEDWAKLPTDAAANLDKYLYGGPRRAP